MALPRLSSGAGSIVALAALLVVCRPAFAAQYETEIEVETELDLHELNQRGAISDATLETLVELMRTGVDLNTSSRDELYELPNLTYADVDALLAYRKLTSWIDDPADLVSANVLTKQQLLQIAPFVVVTEPGTTAPLSGSLRAVSQYSVGDPYAPPYFTQLRAKGFGFSAGLVTVGTRRVLGDVQWDPGRTAFTATQPVYGVELPKFFLQWKAAQRSVIAGTYRIGFGQRLTLDNTTRQTPDGIYPDDAMITTTRALSSFCRLSGGTGGDPECSEVEDELYVTPDFRWRQSFRGVAGSLGDLGSGSTVVSVTGFASHASRNVFQYTVYNRDTCADPHADNERGCAAPPTYVRLDDGSLASSRFSFQTLPALFDEVTGGGNVNVRFGAGRRLGFTGYASHPFWKFPNVDFQEWTRYPYGGTFGAVGVDGQYTWERLNFFLEGARSFDRTPGNGGGFGVIQRSVLSVSKQEVELILRYYDRQFANPYSRATSEPDQLDGQRVRNELGALARYLGRPLPDLAVRAAADFWTLPGDASTPGTAGTPNLRLSLRGDFLGWRVFQPGAWIDYRNKGLGFDVTPDDFGPPVTQVACYEVSTATDSEGDSLPCDGQYLRFIERITLAPAGEYLRLLLQAQQKLVDDPRYPDSMRTDLSFFVQASSRPVESIRLRVRTKWLDEAIDDDTNGERSLWSLIDIAWVMPRRVEVRFRYDNYLWLDQRGSSLTRQPNPEHRMRLELEGRF